MQPLLTALQMREADSHATRGLGIPELVLMEHAAIAVVGALKERFGSALTDTRGIVLAGTGNNGGDALAAARILAQEGATKLFVILVGEEGSASPSAATQLSILGKIGVAWSHTDSANSDLFHACDWIIDGLFGTGLSREVTGPARDLIERVNEVSDRKWIVSADIPSGLSADTGMPLGTAVRASHTVTLGFIKRGLVTGLAADYTGKLSLSPIQIPRDIPHANVATLLFEPSDAARLLPGRRPTSHKGDFGHVHVLAGPAEKQGAAALSALAALKCGAGLVTVVAEKTDLDALRPRLEPDLMTAEWTPDYFSRHPGQTGVVGPGLGTGKSAWEKIKSALRSDWPLVLDADAITVISGQKEAAELLKERESPTVLTPHPKEAARLLGSTVDEVQRDRYAACRALVERYGVHFVLKGKGTLVSGPGLPLICVTSGNTALSKGGTGDVLTGVLAALLAGDMKTTKALPLGVFLHGRAAEIYSDQVGSEYSSTASEIALTLPAVFRELCGWKHG